MDGLDWYEEDGSVPPLRLVLLSLQALSIVFSPVYCLGVYIQDASGPGPSLFKTSYKVPGERLQWANSGEEQQVSKGGCSLSRGCWLLFYSNLILLSQSSYSHTEKPAMIISHSLNESNEQIFILDWPKYAGLYSAKLGRKVHVKNGSSQYMFLGSDNLKFMPVLRQSLYGVGV